MGSRLKKEEKELMKCRVCGSKLESVDRFPNKLTIEDFLRG
jgi:hypothetical protein